MFLISLLVGLLGGLAATVVHPLLLLAALVFVAGGVGIMLAVTVKGSKVFWAYMIFLLFGYFTLGKGFAYIGASPVYVAELGLVLAGFTTAMMLVAGKPMVITSFFRLEVVLLLAFVGWQVLCTIPYLDLYGMDVIRDAALWGYAAFALFILLLVPRESVERLFVSYGRILPYYLVWLLIAWLVTKIIAFPFYFPGSPAPLLYLKSGDVGVHLSGAAAYMLLRLDVRGSPWSNARLWTLWSLWLVNWAAWGASNRAGMFSAVIGIVAVLMWRPRTKWYRPAAIAAVLFALLLLTNFSGPTFGHDNTISTEQITANVTSTFGQSSGVLEATKQWRLDWWKKIVGYTFGGEHFWMGKGYGINLTVDDGSTVGEDGDKLRSPHNVFMTILARSGVPGLILWSLLLASFGWTLVRRATAIMSNNSWENRCALWLLAYWLAFLFNGTFDVFLEGPMGGVWFWSLIGLSLVFITKRNRRPAFRPPRRRMSREVRELSGVG